MSDHSALDGRIRVLAADDDPTVALMMRIALPATDFSVSVVADGNAAAEAMSAHAFDIVLLDVEMPGLDGLQLAAAARQRIGPDFPIVLLTGREDAAFLARCNELGARHVGKPVDWKALAGLVRSWVSH